MSKIQFTLGADPEFFIRRVSDCVFVGAERFLPGTKSKPYPVENGAIQVDGMAAEINIDPARTEDEFVHNLQSVIGQLKAMLPPGYELVATPVAEFGIAEWSNASKEALELGCMPDFNAYTGEKNPQPKTKDRIRTAAGHIHIGWTSGIDPKDIGHEEACRIMVKELDRALSVPLHAMTYEDLKELQRRSLYGKLGAYRPKSYGVEYRTPSNYWLQSEESMRWIWKRTKYIFDNLLEGIFVNQKLSPSFAVLDSGKDMKPSAIKGVISKEDMHPHSALEKFKEDVLSKSKSGISDWAHSNLSELGFSEENIQEVVDILTAHFVEA